jgi:hypothetical protein
MRQNALFHYFLLEEMGRRRRSISFEISPALHMQAGVILDILVLFFEMGVYPGFCIVTMHIAFY